MPAPLPRIEATAADLESQVERRTLRPARRCPMLHDLRVEALIDARNRDQDRRPHRLEVLRQVLRRSRIDHRGADGDRVVVAGGALEGVGQRQKRQEHVARRRGQALVAGLDVGDDVGMREHHALRPAGGARGVDDGREVRRLHVGGSCIGSRERAAAIEPALERHDAAIARLGCRVGAYADDALQACEPVVGRGQLPPAVERVDQQHPGAAVLEDVDDALRVIDGMERHRHQAPRQRRLVHRHVLYAVGHQDRDAVAVGETFLVESPAPALYELPDLLPAIGDPAPGALIEMTVGFCERGCRDAPAEQGRQRADLVQARICALRNVIHGVHFRRERVVVVRAPLLLGRYSLIRATPVKPNFSLR